MPYFQKWQQNSIITKPIAQRMYCVDNKGYKPLFVTEMLQIILHQKPTFKTIILTGNLKLKRYVQTYSN